MSAPLLCDFQTLADGVSSPNPGPLSVTLTGCSVAGTSPRVPPAGAPMRGCAVTGLRTRRRSLKAFLAEEQETGWAVPTGSPHLFPNSGIPREHQEGLGGVGMRTDRRTNRGTPAPVPGYAGASGAHMAVCHLLSKTQFHDSLGDKGFYLPLFKSFRILPEHQITPGKHILMSNTK